MQPFAIPTVVWVPCDIRERVAAEVRAGGAADITLAKPSR